MRHLIDTFLEPVLWFAADWSLRWAALLAVAAMLLWIFRPRRAAMRQLVLLVALIAGLLVPFAPRWGDGWNHHRPQEPSTTLSFPRSAWERTPGRSASRLPPEPDATQSVAHVRPHAERGNEVSRERPFSQTSEPLGRRRLIVLSLASCWGFIVAYQMVRCFCGWILLRRLRRESVEATGTTADLFAACRAELQVGNAVRLAIHPHVRSPILLGCWRPWIIVPPDWPQRSIESQRAGFLHELAHVYRRDHLLAPLLEIIRIAFFFHPLVRWLLARLEHERELLCDEMVVRLGIDRHDYARLLLEFARSSGRLAWPAVSLPMSQRRTVKGRIYHLLEEDMERWIRPLSARWAVVLGVSLLALSLGLASYRVWAVEKAAPPANKPEQQAAPNKPAELPIKREDLTYADKDFNHWRRGLLTELKPAIRADGMKAFAAFGVNGYGTEATQAILEMMRGYDPDIENNPQEEDGLVVKAAYAALHKLGAVAVPTLAAATKGDNRNARRFAIVALGRMGSESEAALPELLQAFKNTDPMTRSLAVGTVGMIHMNQGTKKVVALVMEALKDNNENVRAAAANALECMRKSARSAIPALLNALSDKDAFVRGCVIGALREIGAGKTAVPAVSRLIQDSEQNVRQSAFSYLESLNAEEIKEAIPALIAALKGPDAAIQYRAIGRLASIGPAAKEAIPALSELLRSDNDQIRSRAVEAIKAISPKGGR
jgi:beta-lactamase regulating signal transducer with metallopeptidase domain/HEAT repeat protein